MSKKEKKQNAAIDAYTKNTHRTGRIFVLMFCVYIMVVPLVICAV